MKTFLEYLAEATTDDSKLKHLQHIEDLHIDHGEAGFKHAVSELKRVKEHVESGKSNSSVTQKLDGCVHKDTLVVTEIGIKKISELTNEDRIKCYDIDLDRYEFYHNSTPVSSQGAKKFVKLKFDNGSELICTEDHPILIKELGEYQYVDAIYCEGLST
jgi:hypothetical protein